MSRLRTPLAAPLLILFLLHGALGKSRSASTQGNSRLGLPRHQRLRSEIPQPPSTKASLEGEDEGDGLKGWSGLGSRRVEDGHLWLPALQSVLMGTPIQILPLSVRLTSLLQASPVPPVKWE